MHGLDWYMIFSTETHGFSLSHLYRQSLEMDRNLPALLIVKDIEQNVKKRPFSFCSLIIRFAPLGIWRICTPSINNQ